MFHGYDIRFRRIAEHVAPLIGANPVRTSLFFSGLLVGSPLETYSAKKLYLCEELDVDFSASDSPSIQNILVYDETNSIFSMIGSNSAFWNPTGAGSYVSNGIHCNVQNFWFSCLSSGAFLPYVIFKGIEIIWP